MAEVDRFWKRLPWILTGGNLVGALLTFLYLALPGIVWVGAPARYAPIEEDRSHARRGAVSGAAGVDGPVDGGGGGRRHEGAARGGAGGGWTRAVPVSGVRDADGAV